LPRPGRVTAPLALLLAAASALLIASPSPAHADSIRDREYWLADYGITTAWNTTRGAGVTVAVIDTGISDDHRDLEGAVAGGTDFSGEGSDDGRTPVGTDDPNHGTMVASVLAGRGHGDSGVIGVAPEASLLSISIGFGSSDTSDDPDQQIADAVTWATDNGASVINMSLTRNTADWPESWDTAFLYAKDHDVVIVAAAGNRSDGTTAVGAPATMPGVLTVSGLTREGNASVESSAPGVTVGVAAPSEDLVGAVPGDGYVVWGGTSGATPIVAGAVALVRAAHPDLRAADVINRLTSTAIDDGPDGYDPVFGFGRLDVAAAVAADIPATRENPMGDLGEWILANRAVIATPSATPTSLPEVIAEAPSSVILPLVLVAIFALLVVGILAIWRRFKRTRRKG
jgi:type VII secretion-associated serine protease mycosin